MLLLMSKLDEVIYQLKKSSNGKVFKSPLSDDKLADDYEREMNFHFSTEFRKFLKEADSIDYGTIELLSVTKESSL